MSDDLRPTSDAISLASHLALTEQEAAYVSAARASNTLRGYQSDWDEWSAWCAQESFDPLGGNPSAISLYLTHLASHQAKVGTMARRLSAMRFAYRLRDLPDPTQTARVVAVWEGIRRTHGAPPDQAKPLMPPELQEVLEACPTTRTWRTKGREPEADLGGARDRVLLLVGFIAALRRSELAALDVEHLAEHPRGLVVSIARSKTNQQGSTAELVVLPRGTSAKRCPVQAIQDWMALAQVTSGPLLRPVSKANKALPRRLNGESINTLVQHAVARADIDPSAYSAHSLRAGFVTYAHLRGASDRAIAHQTRHRSLSTIGTYVRISEAWEDNAATQLGI